MEFDDLIPLSQAAPQIPNRRGTLGVAVATVTRWGSIGCRNIRLRTIVVGRTRMTKLVWLEEFFAAVTAAADDAPPRIRTPAARRRAVGAARRELAADGL